MKKTIEDVKNGIKRITSLNERWYARAIDNETTGLPEYKFVPSLTWIADYYPKGVGFYKWLADKGWDEAESLKSAAGERGSKVHSAIETLTTGKEVAMTDKFINPNTEELEDLTVEEYGCLMSWIKWYEDNDKPITLATEFSVMANVEGLEFGCTIDWVGMVKGELTIIDWKTGQNIWPSGRIQISAIAKTIPHWPEEVKERINEHINLDLVDMEGLKLNIVQLGYRRNRNGYKENPQPCQFDLFKHAYAIWKNENEGTKPLQRDYPLRIKIDKYEAKSKGNADNRGGNQIADTGYPTVIPPKESKGGHTTNINQAGGKGINKKTVKSQNKGGTK